MGFDQENEREQRMSLTESQQQVERLAILEMNNTQLYEFIENEQLTNPMLEAEFASIPPEQYITIGQWISYEGGRDGFQDGEEVLEGRYFEVADQQKDSLVDYLYSQLNLHEYTKEEMRRILRVMQHIDEQTGFLVMSEEELRRHMKLSPMELENTLNLIRSLDPPGIASENVTQSLLLQLKRKGITDEKYEDIIRRHMEDIAHGRISSISRSLSITTAQAREYIKVIRTLNPKPVKGSWLGGVEYIVPDVRLIKNGSEWDIEIVNQRVINLGLNELYMEIAKTATEKELVNYFTGRIGRAKFIIKSMAYRREIIQIVTRYMIKRQEKFIFDKGNMKPLTLEEAAADLNLTPAIIGKAIKGKYIELPMGVFPYSRFFIDLVSKGRSEKADTKKDLKNRISKMIKSEDKLSPLSDGDIIDRLNQQGISTSRRTVSKYREELGIGNIFERRL